MRHEAAELAKIAPVFGPQMAYGGTSCAKWPFPSTRQRGPIAASGSGPILVVGTTNDPATPYVWAQNMASEARQRPPHHLSRRGTHGVQQVQLLRERRGRRLLRLGHGPPEGPELLTVCKLALCVRLIGMTIHGGAELGLRERKRIATRRAIQLAALDSCRSAASSRHDRRHQSRRRRLAAHLLQLLRLEGGGRRRGPPGAAAARIPSRCSWTATDRWSSDLADLLADHCRDRARRPRDHPAPEGGRQAVSAPLRHPDGGLPRLRGGADRDRRAAPPSSDPDLAEDDLYGRARLITFVAIAALRHGWLTWAHSPDDEPRSPTRLRESFAARPDAARIGPAGLIGYAL